MRQEVEAKRDIIRQFAECFSVHRDEGRIEHTIDDPVSQRILGLALRYKGLNDRDQSRHPSWLPWQARWRRRASGVVTLSIVGDDWLE